MFTASDSHFWRRQSQKETFLGGRQNGRCWSGFSRAQRQELSSPCTEKLTANRMDPKDNYKDMAINEQSWNSWHCSGLCSTASFDVSYLETPWPGSLVLSLRRVSSKRFLNLTDLADLLLGRQLHVYKQLSEETGETKGITSAEVTWTLNTWACVLGPWYGPGYAQLQSVWAGPPPAKRGNPVIQHCSPC